VSSPSILKRPAVLWSVKEPWTGRPADKGGRAAKALGAKTGGDAVRSTAKGWRPPSASKYAVVERKGTILGGIMAMAAIGVKPWTNYDLKDVAEVKLGNDKTGVALLKLVQRGARRNKDRVPATLSEASEYIRQQAKKNGVGAAAWAARSMFMAGTALSATSKRASVEAKVSTGTKLASKGLKATAAASAPTVVGPVVLGAAAIVLDVVSWVALGVFRRGAK